MENLKLKSVAVSESTDGRSVVGLDESGQVWEYVYTRKRNPNYTDGMPFENMFIVVEGWKKLPMNIII